jgi:hypothetical protein
MTTDSGAEPDFSGDGLADLMLTLAVADGSGSYDRGLLLVSGGIPDGALNGQALSRVTGDALPSAPVFHLVDDVDGDDVSDVMVPYDLVRSTDLRAGGTLDLDEVAHYRFEMESRPTLMGGPDLTGDGRPEWIFGDVRWDPPGNGSESFERTTIIAGFDIPWGDPSKW